MGCRCAAQGDPSACEVGVGWTGAASPGVWDGGGWDTLAGPSPRHAEGVVPQFRQRWTCRRCGHFYETWVSRGKYESNAHVGRQERAAKCSKCGAKDCEIQETLKSVIGTWLDPDFAGKPRPQEPSECGD